MDTSRRIDCYLGTVHWLIASSGLTSWLMAVWAPSHELSSWWLSQHWLLTDSCQSQSHVTTDSWTKCSPLYSLLADCSENTFCKGPVVTETFPAHALYRNSIPLVFQQLTRNVCNCCVIAWFVVGELCLAIPLSREQSHIRAPISRLSGDTSLYIYILIVNDCSHPTLLTFQSISIGETIPWILKTCLPSKRILCVPLYFPLISWPSLHFYQIWLYGLMKHITVWYLWIHGTW
jgi:hypothetical protein